ncbi:MAG: hypothetical protein AUJ57_06460 [Zetaproteobacteria bacterium CG1_02_53_45]|nr:MAG: hypothetical protein AUJ57_06460 [Zetaproteobacteria bacterium CG1_02_53_45]
MQAKGLLGALLKLKRAIKGVTLPEISSVQTFVGVFKAQQTTDGRAANYQTWLDYALNNGMTRMIESKYSRAAMLDEHIYDSALSNDTRRFHRTVVETIHTLAGKLQQKHKIG